MLNWLRNLKFEYGFTEAGNVYTEALVNFYNLLCVFLFSITFLIGYWTIYILVNYTFKKEALMNMGNLYFILKNEIFLRAFVNTRSSDRAFSFLSIADVKDFHLLEGSWCLVPLGFVSNAAYPSIGLEYGISPDITPLVTLKVIAHQWYWVFELEAKVSPVLSEVDDVEVFLQSDAYKLFLETYGDSDAFYKGLKELDFQVLSKLTEVNLKDAGFFRLLTVDNKILLPVNTPIKLIVTSVDVLHSFALPALAVKIDAVPGRLSEQVISIDRPGLYWGQCSELCGPYHGFMPVVLEGVSYPVFVKSFF